MKINDLLRSINHIESIDSKSLIDELSERKLKELLFHDRDRDVKKIEASKAGDTYEKFYANKKYYLTTKRSSEYIDEWIARESKKNIFLDYACGNGFNAIKAAKSGASLALGLDISNVSIKNAKRSAKKENVTNIRFFQADAENTKLPNNSIDRIICSGMLHHLDLSFAFPELRRILKPNGEILCVEALDYNPFIKLYRALTPDMRTEWEKAHILDLKDLEFAERFFKVTDIKYWHVLGYAAGKYPVLSKPLEFLDRYIENVPYLQRLSWIFTFKLIKENS